ncbi:MAG: tetrathionate reductase family octaheme c-type cytochrome [Verrucomicrobia bacterium]|nr:tetrathionate reductase family octaheme c-type cytochrome [Verrucomicrobiota bacterium]
MRISTIAALIAGALIPGSPALAQITHPWLKKYQDASSCTTCHWKEVNGTRITAADEIMETSHWTWEHLDSATGDRLGKKHVINNYCIAVASNEPRCTSCHVGIGWKDKSFDFTDATKVDCLVCHDTTGTYKKFPTLAGAPWTGPGTTNFGGVTWQPVNLLAVAQSVGKTSRATCGACHFFGGGGDAVKHGDLDSSLYNPDRSLDVHMGVNGLNFTCANCHEPTDGHHIPGTYYPKDTTDNQSCQKCHTASPHKTGADANRLNTHSLRVACQTCHIPQFARGRTTKISWDWSTAGQKDANGKNYVQRDANGDPIYDTQKGTFTWQDEVTPEYVWYNGGMTYVTLDDTIDPDQLVTINQLHGSLLDSKSLIFPVKRFTGVQPYDAGRNTLAVPHLFGSDANAYWKSFDWNLSLQAGMSYVDREYSGQLGFLRTEMFWIQNHMVAPKEQALTCASCHTPGARLDFAALGYPPERAAQLQSLAGFAIEEVQVVTQGSGLELHWTGTPGHRYQVQLSADLAQWTDAPNGQRDAGLTPSELSWADDAAGNLRFYRIVRTAN